MRSTPDGSRSTGMERAERSYRTIRRCNLVARYNQCNWFASVHNFHLRCSFLTYTCNAIAIAGRRGYTEANRVFQELTQS